MLTTNLATATNLVLPSLAQTLSLTGQPALPQLITPATQAKTTTHDGRTFARTETGLLLPA